MEETKDICRYSASKRVKLTTRIIAIDEYEAETIADSLDSGDWEEEEEIDGPMVFDQETIAAVTIAWDEQSLDRRHEISEHTWKEIVGLICKEFNIVIDY